MQNGTVYLEYSLMVFYKIKTLFPYDSASVFLGIFPKELKVISTQKHEHGCLQQVYSYCKNLEGIKMSYSSRMDKYNGISLKIKKNWTIQPWKDVKEP